MQNHKHKLQAAEGKRHSYWLYGIHAVKSALLNEKREIRRIVATKPAVEKLVSECRRRGIIPETASPQEINHMLPEGAVHQGVAIEVKPLPPVALEEYLAHAEKKPLLLLDQVTDPHNVGAILRSAAAFDAGAVIITKDHAPQESAALAKASSGGIEIVPLITVTNLTQAMEELKKCGYWCVGLDGEAKQAIAEVELKLATTALVLGAEGRGLRRLTAERCDLLVRLPISLRMESLNVSNAAAVALYALSLNRC